MRRTILPKLNPPKALRNISIRCYIVVSNKQHWTSIGVVQKHTQQQKGNRFSKTWQSFQYLLSPQAFEPFPLKVSLLLLSWQIKKKKGTQTSIVDLIIVTTHNSSWWPQPGSNDILDSKQIYIWIIKSMQGTSQELLPWHLVKGTLSSPAPLFPGPLFFPYLCRKLCFTSPFSELSDNYCSLQVPMVMTKILIKHSEISQDTHMHLSLKQSCIDLSRNSINKRRDR